MKISKQNAEHYIWGDRCDGWHLVKNQELSVIHERMPAHTAEARHYHLQARQFFFVLSGTATLEVNGEEIALGPQEGMEVPPLTPHQMFNKSEEAIEFMVISQPTARGDRVSVKLAEWITRAMGEGSAILSMTLLKGGISATLHSLKLQVGDQQQDVVLRQFTNREWLQEAPDLARREAECLAWAEAVDLPTPQVIAFDETGEQSGGVPAVLMTKVQGQVELKPQDLGHWLTELASALVRIHQVDATSFERKYFTYNDLAKLTVPAWSDQKELWQEALHLVTGPRPEVQECFIHRDYHPTNVLWQDGHVSGVVDWVNACRGPAGIDVGHCRLNLAHLYGAEAADQFLEDYQAAAGSSFVYDPYWDLVSIMECLPGPVDVYAGWTDLGVTDLTPQMMKERLERHLARTMERAGRSPR